MKNKPLILTFFLVIVLTALSCALPVSLGTPTSTATDTSPSTAEVSLEAPSEPTIPTATITEALTATITPTTAPDLSPYAAPQIFSIRMFSPSRGWAVADGLNRLLVTEDGGETWLDATPLELHPLPSGLTSLGLRPFFLDENTAWFSTSTAAVSTLFHTEDGGVNWEKIAVPSDRTSYFFLGPNQGFALEDLGAGAGSHYVALHSTNDGGETWMEVFSHEPGESKSLPERGTKNGITFLDQVRGFIGGSIPMTDHFHFYVTSDGGRTWTQETDIALPDAFAGSFLDVWQPIFLNQQTGVLPVRATGEEIILLIYRTDDGGNTWHYHDAVPGGQDVDFLNMEQGWIAAEASLFRTVDGGANWEAVPYSGIPAGDRLQQVDFVDPDTGWLLTYTNEGSTSLRKLYGTGDGGETWILLQP